MGYSSGRPLRKSRTVLWWSLLVLGGLLGTLVGCDLLPLDGAKPPTPTQVSATSDSFTDRVRITWEPVPEAGGYEVWRSSSQSGEYQFLARTGHLSYDDLSVTPGLVYWYKVRSCNRVGYSEFSQPVSGRAKVIIAEPPPVPTDLTASQGVYPDRVEVTWTAVPGASQYGLYRDTVATGSYTLIATVEGTSYMDMDVSPGETYWYKLRACNDFGCSDLSQAASGYAGLQAALPTPTNLSASDGEYADRIEVSWDPVDGAANYLLYRSTAQEGPYELLVDVTEPTYQDREVATGVEYWYRVRACNDQGCSALSEPDVGSVSGEEEMPPPPPESYIP